MSRNRRFPDAPTLTESHPGGDVVEWHRHVDHQLIYVSAGVVAIQTERGAWVATPERAVWIPAATWHQHRFHGRSSFHTIGFPLRNPPLPDTVPTVLAVSALVRELLVACTEPGLPPAQERRIRAVLNDRLQRAREQPLSLATPRDPRLAHACQLVESDLAHPVTLDRLAAAVGTSQRTLTRLFRAEFGTTYPQWRTQTRLFHALIQLADGASVTDTAHRCGWATTSAFIDTFAHTRGQTPGAYRTAPGRRSRTRDSL